MDGKKPWLSKTLWWNALVAVTAFIPVVGEWVVAHPEAYALLVTIVNAILRATTKDQLQLS